MVVPQQTTAKGKHAAAGKPLAACETCGMAFKKLEHLQRHIRTHTQDRPYPCTYSGCGKAFARQDTLNRHARLHNRDEQDGGKPRARKRTKSVSEGSTSGPRRQSTSPYPTPSAAAAAAGSAHNFHHQRRRSSTTSSSVSNAAAPSAFGLHQHQQSPPAVTIPDLSPNAPSSSLSAHPRFSTFDLLGLSPSFQPSAHHQLPALSELYPDDGTAATSSSTTAGAGGGAPSTSAPGSARRDSFAAASPTAASPGVGAFGSFSPMAHSLFLPQQQQQQQQQSSFPRSPGALQSHHLDFDAQPFAPSPVNTTSDDDNLSSTSDPSSLTPESFGSTLATSFHSSFKGSSPDEFKHPQAPLHSVSGFEPVTHMTIPEHQSVSHAQQPRGGDDKSHKFSSPSAYIDDDDLLSMFGESQDKVPSLSAPPQPQHDMGHSMPISMGHASSSVAAMSIPVLDQHYGWPVPHHQQAQSAPAANGLGMMGMPGPASSMDYLRQWSGHDFAPSNKQQQQAAQPSFFSSSYNDTSSYSFDLPTYLRDV